MISFFYFFAAVLILLSFKSFRGGVAYLKFVRTELAKPRSEFTPFATVIAPCRGIDPGLAENLSSLVEQDYPAYEVIFVVDDAADPATSVIENICHRRDAETQRDELELEKQTDSSPSSASQRCGESEVSVELIVAPKAQGSSQKVENLRTAVMHAAERSNAFVFVDTDARPSREWLRYLIEPLKHERIGAATGYRWFISQNPSFGSEMRSAWNASIASALGPNENTNFCWGGSLAIRRDVFERLDIREKWRGTLSDDFTVTRIIKAASLSVVFVPQAVTASVEDCRFREMLEFTTRQMKITRVYAPNLWLRSLFGSGLFCSVMIACFPIIILSQKNDFAVSAAIATLILVTIFSIGKAWLRLSAVKLILKNHETALKWQFFTQITFWLLAPAVFFCNSIAAWLSRRVIWRGITYELKSPTETVIIAD